MSAQGIASLAMYPFPDLAAGYDNLWSQVHRRAPWTPSRLDREVGLHPSWIDPDLVVAQTCGWPLVTALADRVRVVGAFRHAHPQAEGVSYRSVVLATHPGAAADFSGAVAAANDPNSLSGWISLIAAVEGPGGSWAGQVRWSGAHLDSLRMLQAGAAEIASIDSVTLAHLRRLEPGLVEGLHEVGQGPRVPSLPLITSRGTDDARLADLRDAFAVAARAAAPELLIAGFEPLDLVDYLPVLDYAPGPPAEP